MPMQCAWLAQIVGDIQAGLFTLAQAQNRPEISAVDTHGIGFKPVKELADTLLQAKFKHPHPIQHLARILRRDRQWLIVGKIARRHHLTGIEHIAANRRHPKCCAPCHQHVSAAHIEDCGCHLWLRFCHIYRVI